MDAVAGSLEGAGVDEAAWMASPGLAGLPRASWSALLDAAARVVIVAPHPDDEVLGAGGLVQAATSSGVPVRVVIVTRGEACYPGDPAWPPARLAAVRPQESLSALKMLGVGARNVCQLSIQDGGVAAHADALRAHLGRMIDARDHILTTWSRDGHPDHQATAHAVAAAARAAGARASAFPVWAWHWMDPRLPLPLPGARRYPLTRAQRAAKVAALKSFVSQRQHGESPILSGAVLARFSRSFEVFCDDRG